MPSSMLLYCTMIVLMIDYVQVVVLMNLIYPVRNNSIMTGQLLPFQLLEAAATTALLWLPDRGRPGPPVVACFPAFVALLT